MPETELSKPGVQAGSGIRSGPEVDVEAGTAVKKEKRRWAVEPDPDAEPRTQPKQNGERYRLLRNIGALAVCPMQGGQAHIHLIRNAVILWKGGIIQYAGPEDGLAEWFRSRDMIGDGQNGDSENGDMSNSGQVSGQMPLPHHMEIFDAGGRLVVPGLVDCHTHLAFGGWRPDEFEMRALGRTYEEIAAAGGGILSTMKATREASEEELLEKSAGLLHRMVSLGVTTIECKSGYGLRLEDELKQLRVYHRLQMQSPVRIMSTFLGAHAIPPEYNNNRDGYISLIIDEMIPAVAEQELATFCDVFADAPAFTQEEARKILAAAVDAGLIPKIHADQLTEAGGAELAAELGAISADHLECISDKGIAAMKEAGTIAVSLPLATWYLRKQPLPARDLIGAGVPLAVSTDFNPGSAPSYHLPLAMHLACTIQYMSPAEVLKGATIYAAAAIGLDGVTGSVEPGKKADFVEIDVKDIQDGLSHGTLPGISHGVSPGIPEGVSHGISSGVSFDPVNQWMYHFQPNNAVRVWAGGECVAAMEHNNNT
ncbi:MAG: imidazolonepropionase [Bacteroidota bacterium]